jgi:hypothetical protein
MTCRTAVELPVELLSNRCVLHPPYTPLLCNTGVGSWTANPGCLALSGLDLNSVLSSLIAVPQVGAFAAMRMAATFDAADIGKLSGPHIFQPDAGGFGAVFS